MKYCLFISLFSFTTLLMFSSALSASMAHTATMTAMSNLQTDKQSCCMKESISKSKKTCCKFDGQDEENGCDGSCKNHKCHSLVIGHGQILKSGMEMNIRPDLFLSRAIWSFESHIPKPVYLAIWIPPRKSDY